MCTTSGKGRGAATAHKFKGFRFWEGTPGYATSVNAVRTRGRLRKDERGVKAVASQLVVILDMMREGNMDLWEREAMDEWAEGRAEERRKRGGKGL